MFPRKPLLAVALAASFSAPPAAFATPAPDLPSHPALLSQPTQSTPLRVDSGDGAVPIVLLAFAGALAVAGGAGMVALHPRPRPAR